MSNSKAEHAEETVLLSQSRMLTDSDRTALAALSAADVKMCRIGGVSPTEFLAQRRREEADAAARRAAAEG